MPHNNEKQRQETSLVGRLLSLEAALLLMGAGSLIYGLINGVFMNIFFGVIIIPGVFVLHKVKRKDWKAHWAELEAQQQRERERKGNDAR